MQALCCTAKKVTNKSQFRFCFNFKTVEMFSCKFIDLFSFICLSVHTRTPVSLSIIGFLHFCTSLTCANCSVNNIFCKCHKPSPVYILISPFMQIEKLAKDKSNKFFLDIFGPTCLNIALLNFIKRSENESGNNLTICSLEFCLMTIHSQSVPIYCICTYPNFLSILLFLKLLFVILSKICRFYLPPKTKLSYTRASNN